jgi:ribosomal protein RSM22 (predicted rRNA methylase)
LKEHSPGWCHFSARLERPAFHRLIKDVKLSYEDEKFCYLIVEKTNVAKIVDSSSDQSKLRLMNDPQLRKGHVRLIGCNGDCDIQEAVVSKKHKCYREARTASWGDFVVLEE